MKRFVTIAGNIGVGKSTLTALLERRLGWEPFYEAVNDNPYLADFYADMERWAFHSQIFFLSRRLAHHRAILDHPASAIQDRSVYEDAEIFARNLYLQGKMSERDYAAYQELYEAVRAFIPPPDLIVYLSANVETLRTRIAHRGRDFERSISPEYLQQLNTLYDSWLDRFDLCPILTIPTDEIDFVEDEHHLHRIANHILDRLQGRDVLSLS
ncbi:MAG: deoxynucleoside kinase [Anaerolineales bacterium]|nr:deoxynucleoside kinase [Anaerolineales bacterium]MCB9128988.1 deoxynucleoside kinase [Ardenticatenales bacterium]